MFSFDVNCNDRDSGCYQHGFDTFLLTYTKFYF